MRKFASVKTVRPNIKAVIAAALLLATSLEPAFAQFGLWRRKPSQKQRPAVVHDDPKSLMHFEIIEGDTVYFDILNPSVVHTRRKKGKQWRKYYRLVYNFNKVYPYTAIAHKLEHEADSTIAARHMNKKERQEYIKGVQKELLHTFEPVIRHMTISQGALLIRLVDRELGRTTYAIIKDYRSGLAAGFWQGVARLFGQNLKNRYDPEGADKETEELVKAWENGTFPQIYYSVFGNWPEETEIPSKYR
ncbi:MAG: DUF4294 domain-containing protein [Bacteroidales bacterium]|nr:DUF4294 domain-containing protein [Bacteroidales bacterium]